jgi:hypothetical protein
MTTYVVSCRGQIRFVLFPEEKDPKATHHRDKAIGDAFESFGSLSKRLKQLTVGFEHFRRNETRNHSLSHHRQIGYLATIMRRAQEQKSEGGYIY